MSLPVNFVDDILDSSMSGKRRYRMVPNADGTTSFEDETTYTQNGSPFGAAQINATNAAVNALSIYLGPYTLTSGISTYTITDSNIHSDDETCDLYFMIAEADKETWSDAEPTITQSEGYATITFSTALAASVKICSVHVVNH